MQFPISRFLTSSIPNPDATALQAHSVQLPLVSNYILDIDNPLRKHGHVGNVVITDAAAAEKRFHSELCKGIGHIYAKQLCV